MLDIYLFDLQIWVKVIDDIAKARPNGPPLLCCQACICREMFHIVIMEK